MPWKFFTELFEVFGDNLLVNGSFEEGTFAPELETGYVLLKMNSKQLKGWTIEGYDAQVGHDIVTWMRNDNAHGIKTNAGSFFADLTGYYYEPVDFIYGPVFGGVGQEFATQPGAKYRVSFLVGSFEDQPHVAAPVEVLLTAPKTSRTFGHNRKLNAGNLWTRHNVVFTAIDTRSGVIFQGMDVLSRRGGQPSYYIGLDDVSVRRTHGLVAGLLRGGLAVATTLGRLFGRVSRERRSS